jgi:hypothetical protein
MSREITFSRSSTRYLCRDKKERCVREDLRGGGGEGGIVPREDAVLDIVPSSLDSLGEEVRER